MIKYYIHSSSGFVNDSVMYATDRDDVAQHLDAHEDTQAVSRDLAIKLLIRNKNSLARPAVEYADLVDTGKVFDDLTAMMIDHTNYTFKSHGYVVI